MLFPDEQHVPDASLFGHEAAEAVFHKAFASGKLHHAWLISGPRGIGKATLAWQFARHVLSPAADPAVLGRISAGSHSDLLVLSPPEDEEKDETKREIPVEQARAAGEFLSLTPAEGDWRVVIVDSIDEMNANAANALLKTLEEPPPRALLMLVSHNPGRLLPTIRSRCRMLKLPPLSAEAFRRALRRQAPDMDKTEAEQLGVLSHYSPGVALALRAHEGVELYADFVKLAGQGEGILAFAERMTGSQPHARWQVMGQLAARFFERALEVGLRSSSEAIAPNNPRSGSEAVAHEVVPGEGAACQTLLNRLSPPGIAELHARALEQFSVATRLHLDYKTAMITFLHSLRTAA